METVGITGKETDGITGIVTNNHLVAAPTTVSIHSSGIGPGHSGCIAMGHNGSCGPLVGLTRNLLCLLGLPPSLQQFKPDRGPHMLKGTVVKDNSVNMHGVGPKMDEQIPYLYHHYYSLSSLNVYLK